MLLFSKSKAINDAQIHWLAIRYMCEHPFPLCGWCFAPSAPSVSTQAQRQKWWFMKTPPANSSFDIFLFFFYTSLFSTSKWLKVIFITYQPYQDNKQTVLLTVFISTDMSLVSLLNDMLRRVIKPHAAQLPYSQLLQIEDFGSNIHGLN